MEIEKRLRPDLWKAVCAHYERADYAESVRDAVFHVCELLREKSGIEDKDGTKLVDAALMGANPPISVSKNETTTEKDFQQGIGFSFKGIMQAIRNPLSHEKTEYSQEDAEAIILYINFLLNQVDHSGGFSKIESITNLLYDEDTPSSAEYADLLLKEVPVKKRYDLLVELFNDRENLRQHALKNFITKLYDSLAKASKTDFTRLLNASLLTCKDDYALRMYIHYFMENTYQDLDKLVQLRIESFLFKAIRAGKMVTKIDPKTKKPERDCISEGTLATWIVDPDLVHLLGNADKILDELVRKIQMCNEDEEEFVFEYFGSYLYDNIEQFSDYHKNIFNRRLINGDEQLYDFLFEEIETFQNEKLCEWFGEAFHKCEEVIRNNAETEEQLPF